MNSSPLASAGRCFPITSKRVSPHARPTEAGQLKEDEMSEAKHTPLPWKYAERPRNVRPQFIILDSLGNEVVFLSCHQQAMKVYGEDLKRERDIMRQIVRTVNNHDALVEALDEGMNVLADIAVEEDFKGWNDTIAKMSKALTKAKGES